MLRHFVGIGVDVQHADFRFVRSRIKHVAEIHRDEFARLHGDNRARAAVQQETHRPVAEFARIFGVKRNRRGAAQFIADVLGNHGHFDAQFFQFGLNVFFQHVAEINFSEPHMPEFIALGGRQILQIFFRDDFRDAFGNHDHAVRTPHFQAFDNRAEN